MNKLFAFLFISALSTGLFSTAQAETIAGSGIMYRVIDGDTFDVRIDDDLVFNRFVAAADGNERRQRYVKERQRTIRIRLASIDTPESVHANSSRNSAAGREASKVVKELMDRKPVQFTCFDHGRYGRSICNIAFNQGGSMTDLGAWLIRNGYSRYVTAWGRNPYLDTEYRAADSAANGGV